MGWVMVGMSHDDGFDMFKLHIDFGTGPPAPKAGAQQANEPRAIDNAKRIFKKTRIWIELSYGWRCMM